MKLNYKKVIFTGFAFFLICAFWQAYDNIVPLMLVNKFGLNQTLSGVIMSLDNILALFMLPIFGTLSDKTNTKYGKRTPYIVIGTLIAVMAFFSLSFADNAQLGKMTSVSQDSKVFYEELFESDYEITNAEYSSIDNKDVSKKYSVQDYAAQVVFNKNYDELLEEEKSVAREWYVNINYEYLHSEKHKEPETVYYYDGEEYHTVSVVKVDEKNYKYYIDGENEIKKTDTKNAYTNLVTPAISRYAWSKTIKNPLPLVCFGLLLLLTLIAMAVFRSPAVALMPDITVKPLRSKANAIINLMGTAGGMLVLALGIVFETGKAYNQLMSYVGYIGAVCLVMVIGLLVFIWKVKEPKWVKEMEEESVKYGIEEREEGSDAPVQHKKLSKPELKSLILILTSVALWYIAYNAVTSKYSLYATNVLHMDYNTTLLLAQAAAIVAYIPVGILAEKFGRKKCILAGVIMLTAAFFGAIFMTANSPVILLDIIFAVAGIGWATINVNSFPMAVEVAKNGDVGKYTGYYYTASMAAQIVTPILSGALMDLFGNMRPLFPYATIFAALAFVTMLFVKHGDNKPKQKGSVLENFDVDD